MRITVCALLLLMMFGCRKESWNGSANASISISADSIAFDTLFTSTGSITKVFKIYNDNRQKLLIQSIAVAGGQSSSFRINADGYSGPEVNNLEMEAGDSLYVFVSAHISPDEEDLPFLVRDSIQITFNGQQRLVQLSAWGQNAHFIPASTIDSDTVWTADRPFVVLGPLHVAENATLKIASGARIYFHADAPLLVSGTLLAVGEMYDSTKIIFQGDRLDEGYRDHPGGWPGIYILPGSGENLLKHVILKNAYQGLVVEGGAEQSTPTLQLEEVVIDNCFDAGIIGSGTSIRAVNCLVSNCGRNITLVNGGNYELTHCTNVAISNALVPHRQPVMTIAGPGSVQARFTNCIFWGHNGTVDQEILLEDTESDIFEVEFLSCLRDEDPKFRNIDIRDGKYDFRLREESPAIKAGENAGIFFDLDGNERHSLTPSIGAYEL